MLQYHEIIYIIIYFISSPRIQFLNWSTASLQADSRLSFFKPHRGASSLGLIANYLTNGGLGCTVRQEKSVTPGIYGTYCWPWWKRSWIFSMIWLICLWQYASRSLKVSRACSTRFSQLRLVVGFQGIADVVRYLWVLLEQVAWKATTRCRVWSWATSWWSEGSMGGGRARAARERKVASHPPHPWAKSQRGCESFCLQSAHSCMRNWMQALITYTPSKLAKKK